VVYLFPMSHPKPALLRWLMRHGLVALVIVATLAAACGFTAQVQVDASPDAVCAASGQCMGHGLGLGAGSDLDAPESGHESDSHEHCHCQLPAVGFPSGMPVWTSSVGVTCDHAVVTMRVPDALSFAPEPPPIRV
jgi:hypothetical protein